MERNCTVFDDMPFSLSSLKTSSVSMLVSWAGSIELEECCAFYTFSRGW